MTKRLGSNKRLRKIPRVVPEQRLSATHLKMLLLHLQELVVIAWGTMKATDYSRTRVDGHGPAPEPVTSVQIHAFEQLRYCRRILCDKDFAALMRAIDRPTSGRKQSGEAEVKRLAVCLVKLAPMFGLDSRDRFFPGDGRKAVGPRHSEIR
jgi:hypothetical protein